MSWRQKLSNIMYGQSADEDYVEEEYEGTEEESFEAEAAPEQAPARAGNQFGISSGSSIEMKVVKPDKLDCASQIADHLLARKTILLNLEETNKETARRLLDFLSGVAYSINGNLKRVANNTYVITPCNVDVSDGPLREKRQKDTSSDYYENDI